MQIADDHKRLCSIIRPETTYDGHGGPAEGTEELSVDETGPHQVAGARRTCEARSIAYEGTGEELPRGRELEQARPGDTC